LKITEKVPFIFKEQLNIKLRLIDLS